MNHDYQAIEKKARTRRTVLRTITYLFLVFWGLVVLFPFYWMILTSLKSYGAYNSEYVPKFIRYLRSHSIESEYVSDAMTAVTLSASSEASRYSTTE